MASASSTGTSFFTGGPSTEVQAGQKELLGGLFTTIPTAVAAGTIAAGGSACFTAPAGVDCFLNQLECHNRNAGASVVNIYIAPASPAPGSYTNYQSVTKSCPTVVTTQIVNPSQGYGPLFIPAGWALHVVSTNGADCNINFQISREH